MPISLTAHTPSSSSTLAIYTSQLRILNHHSLQCPLPVQFFYYTLSMSEAIHSSNSSCLVTYSLYCLKQSSFHPLFKHSLSLPSYWYTITIVWFSSVVAFHYSNVHLICSLHFNSKWMIAGSSALRRRTYRSKTFTWRSGFIHAIV